MEPFDDFEQNLVEQLTSKQTGQPLLEYVAQALNAAQKNQGAFQVLIQLYRRQNGKLLEVFKKNNLVGTCIYKLWSEVCGEDDARLDALLEELDKADNPDLVTRTNHEGNQVRVLDFIREDLAWDIPQALDILTSLHQRKKDNLIEVLVKHHLLGCCIFFLWSDVCGKSNDQLDAVLQEIDAAEEPRLVTRSFGDYKDKSVIDYIYQRQYKCPCAT